MISPTVAHAKAAQVDYLLLRLKQRLVVLPNALEIVEFLRQDGQALPATMIAAPASRLTLAELRRRYLETNSA